MLPGRTAKTLIYLTLSAGALAAMGALEVMPSRILVRLGTWSDHISALVSFHVLNVTTPTSSRTIELDRLSAWRQFGSRSLRH